MAGVQKGETYFAVPIWTGAIYEARKRQRDGVLTLRRVGSFGDTRSGFEPSPAFIAELQDAAEHPWVDKARNGDVVQDEDAATKTRSDSRKRTRSTRGKHAAHSSH